MTLGELMKHSTESHPLCLASTTTILPLPVLIPLPDRQPTDHPDTLNIRLLLPTALHAQNNQPPDRQTTRHTTEYPTSLSDSRLRLHCT
ncbi:hypothetical protein Pcinc_033230 [Petrolisthes cinctipes]|uniref:Uncharacterized protein n=1 Tax=Petrolisthes cinctipes TaxID=88211 RepID=A0AAE1ESP3_PETCI|nr:hypothetical protein Pcinc_033230 [Petrolisthes cinctipes]